MTPSPLKTLTIEYADGTKHVLKLYQSPKRRNSYLVLLDGQQLSDNMGWSRTLEMVRKTL